MKSFQPCLLGIVATLAISSSLMGAPSAPQSPEAKRDYPRELGSAAETHIEHKNAGMKDLPDAKRDRLHPDVDEDQDVEYMFEESEVW